jgi:hypothetical protein
MDPPFEKKKLSEGFRQGVRLWECTKTTFNTPVMKLRYLLPILPVLALTPAVTLAQQPPPQQRQISPAAVGIASGSVTAPASKKEEKSFSLTFQGGPVEDFVKAVETASGEPFNVIIPASAQDLTIPPVRVKEVTLSPLLNALSSSSREQKPVLVSQSRVGGQATASIQYHETGFTFTPTEGSGGSVVWQLTVQKSAELPERAQTPSARFYQLKPNLESGLKVEDIITVAQTAWKMMKLDAKEIPDLKVHEETGILIAVGSESALGVIESVLRELPRKDSGGGSGQLRVNPQSQPFVPPTAGPPSRQVR